MHRLSGYTVDQQIHQSDNSTVYRGRNQHTGLPVIIKFLTETTSIMYANTKLRQEYTIVQQLDSAHIVKVYELAPYQDSYALIFEDFGGVALRQLLTEKPFSISQVLRCLLQLVEGLGVIHDHHIIHKDINSRNIIIHPETFQIKISDFGIATLLSHETADISNTHVMAGTLSYISPEQTGRMKRPIDYRTDFYSLGVVAYELLTGRLPFYGNDQLEIIHQHIAKLAQEPKALRPAMPSMLSAIVMKLLAKSADERYQSAYGLKRDLEKCAAQYNENGYIEPFPLAEFDFSERFHLPQKLYGREADLAAIGELFQGTTAGATHLLTVSGPAGIGKSVFIEELHKILVGTGTHLISGKFDQYKLGLPYSALIDAFKDFVTQIRQYPKELAYWRARLQTAVGQNGQVLVDVLPDLERIIGEQPALVELDAVDSQHRFSAVISELIASLTHKTHPLILFIDDVQWADRATLKLLETLLNGPSMGYLMVILSYRDNEVEPLHPLRLFLKQYQEQGRKLYQIKLAPLSFNDQLHLVSDTLNLALSEIEPLTQLIASRTDGNPFFVAELLKTLHQKKLIYLDYVHGRWNWKLAEIQQLGITQNVVDLMQSKIQELPLESQSAIELAACIGNTFNLHILALVSEHTPRETLLALFPAITLGLLIPVGDGHRFLKFVSPETEDAMFNILTFDFKFLHDRIQQAAYQLLPAGRKQHVHLRIGRYFKAKIAEYEREEYIFEIVNHLNTAMDLLTDQAECNELGHLNMIAAQRSKASNAYTEALQFYTVAINLLPAFSWQTHYSTTFQLYLETAETEYLLGDVAAARVRCAWLLQQTQNPLEQAQIYEILLLSHTAQKEFSQGIDVALKALKLLNIDLPRYPNFGHVGLNLAKTRLTIGLRSPKTLAELPVMTDRGQRMAMRLMVLTSPLAYQSEPDLLPILVFAMVRLSVIYGNTPLSSYAFLVYGMAMNGVLGNLKAGLAYTETGLAIMQRFNSVELRAKNEGMYNFFLRHWKEPLRATVAPMLELAQAGQEVGDVEYQAYNYFFYCQARFVLGDNLELLEEEFTAYHDALIRLGQDVQEHVMAILFQMVLNLRGQAADNIVLHGSRFDLVKAQDASFDSAVFYRAYYQAMLYFLLKQPQQALKHILYAAKFVAGVMSMNVVPVFYFYYALIVLAVYPQTPAYLKAWRWFQVKRSLNKLREWAGYAPENQAHRVAILEAEMARVQFLHAEAIELYAYAIKLARASEYIQDYALVNELAGDYFLLLDNPEMARTYLLEAYRSYSRWGALAKLHQLEQSFAFLRRNKRDSDEFDTLHLSSHDISTTIALDFNSVLKASQSISGEIQLERLLDKLMSSVIENAGAQRGFLLLPAGEHWMIEATGFIGPHLPLNQLPIDAARSRLVPMSVIRFVAHSCTHVLLKDALKSLDFADDDYMQRVKPRSILCTPLLKQGMLMGILYLENNLVAEVFTLESLEVVNLLASQAAISLDNARLYANLEGLVSQRTQDLQAANQQLSLLNDQLTSEVQLARTIQESLLPAVSPGWPALDVICSMTSARAVGGDLYTYYEFNPEKKPERYAVVVGDVSGKGMPAALLMGVSLASFRAVVQRGLDPSALLAQLDADMVPYTRTTRQNCALLYCDIRVDDAGCYDFRIANAGCVMPLLRTRTGALHWLEVGGFPLGTGLGTVGYQVVSGSLRPGDSLILCSDGAIEAMNEDYEMFGFERFEQAVLSGPTQPEALLDYVQTAINLFVNEVDAHDDMTLVVIQIPAKR